MPGTQQINSVKVEGEEERRQRGKGERRGSYLWVAVYLSDFSFNNKYLGGVHFCFARVGWERTTELLSGFKLIKCFKNSDFLISVCLISNIFHSTQFPTWLNFPQFSRIWGSWKWLFNAHMWSPRQLSRPPGGFLSTFPMRP